MNDSTFIYKPESMQKLFCKLSEKGSILKRALLFSVLLLPGFATSWAYDFEVDGLCYNITSDAEVEVTYESSDYGSSDNYSGLSGELTIPETVTYGGSTYAVTAIERWAFGYCSELTSVTIPESVTSIGDDAFSGCTSLASITIPNGVTKIESATFDSCYALESVTIGSGVTSVAALAFYKCTSLTEIYSLNPTPPTIITSFAFFEVDRENCVLYVPEGSYKAYATANAWSGFLNIVEVDFGGIEETISDNADASEIARYDISGRLLSEPQKGINIVRYSDGTVEKVIVK